MSFQVRVGVVTFPPPPFLVGGLEAGVVGVAGGGDVTAGVVEEEYI